MAAFLNKHAFGIPLACYCALYPWNRIHRVSDFDPPSLLGSFTKTSVSRKFTSYMMLDVYCPINNKTWCYQQQTLFAI